MAVLCAVPLACSNGENEKLIVALISHPSPHPFFSPSLFFSLFFFFSFSSSSPLPFLLLYDNAPNQWRNGLFLSSF